MRNGKKQSALLVEIIIAVLFFALSATVILQTFAAAYKQGVYASTCNDAMAMAQNLAGRLYVSDAPEALLEAEGFSAEGNVWSMDAQRYTLQVKFDTTATAAGEIYTAQISAIRNDEVFLEIPCARYVPGEVSE